MTTVRLGWANQNASIPGQLFANLTDSFRTANTPHPKRTIPHTESDHTAITTIIAMGIWDAFSEIVEAVTPWSVVEAEAPAEETQVGGMSFFGCEERARERKK